MLIQQLQDPLFKREQIKLYTCRLDLLPPYRSGNKWFKLKYNLARAKQLQHKTLLTFGGAYSNHIHAVAQIGKAYGFGTLGIIRGEETLPLNPVLSFAQQCGMHLIYVDRKTYQKKHTLTFIHTLKKKFHDFYLIPEGGSNAWAVKGCTEILNKISLAWNYLCIPCGTGGTLAGLIASSPTNKKILGFAVLKGANFLKDQTLSLLQTYQKTFHTTITHNHFELFFDYHFGGYAKKTPSLAVFISKFIQKHHIPIEPIYTGKMFYGIYDLIQKKYFPPHATILALHTGGLHNFKT